MKIAKNQKGFNELTIDNTLWNEIKRIENKILVAYGSNGKGKSTIKELFQQQNLAENFDLSGYVQQNEFYNEFGNSKFLVYDEQFIDSFVYTNNDLSQNELKIILKNSDITKIINEKKTTNVLIENVLKISNQFINNISNISSVLNLSSDGKISAAQKRFATTFISGELHNKYEDLFSISDDEHKKWWYEGLRIYKQCNLDNCPWCQSEKLLFNENMSAQLNSVNEVNKIDGKFFSDKTAKINGLENLKSDYNLSQDIISRIDTVIEYISNSIESNKEQCIVDEMKIMRRSLDKDKSIFEEIVTRIKLIDNVLDINTTDLKNKLNDLCFFDCKDNLIDKLSKDIDDFINYSTSLVESIKNSNLQLLESIGNSVDQANELLQNLGMKYRVKVNSNQIIDSGIEAQADYVSIVNLNGQDISTNISSVLSYGEKSTLAFSIFIQQIRNLTDSDTVIIFDDPISSYDIFRRYTTVNIINTLTTISFKKMIILTHESNFLTSVINNFKSLNITAVLLNEKNDNEICIEEIDSNFNAEVNLYKNMLNFSNGNIRISQRALALRQLHDLRKFILDEQRNLSFYNYICKLIHYRKDENTCWDPSYSSDIRKLFDYFGIVYNSSINQIQNESLFFADVDSLLSDIIIKSPYDLSLEELCSIRMISESAVRNESRLPNRFKKSAQSLWKINDSSKQKELSNYKAILNSLSHIDDDEVAWPSLCVNDMKAIPKIVISQLLNILK